MRSAAADSARLSSTTRVVRLAIPQDVEGSRKFRLTVSSVYNPAHLPVELTATLIASRDSIAIGSVALFPVDSGGVFALSLPERARVSISRSLRAKEPPQMLIELLGRRAGEVSLTVSVGGWER